MKVLELYTNQSQFRDADDFMFTFGKLYDIPLPKEEVNKFYEEKVKASNKHLTVYFIEESTIVTYSTKSAIKSSVKKLMPNGEEVPV